MIFRTLYLYRKNFTKKCLILFQSYTVYHHIHGNVMVLPELVLYVMPSIKHINTYININVHAIVKRHANETVNKTKRMCPFQYFLISGNKVRFALHLFLSFAANTLRHFYDIETDSLCEGTTFTNGDHITDLDITTREIQ